MSELGNDCGGLQQYLPPLSLRRGASYKTFIWYSSIILLSTQHRLIYSDISAGKDMEIYGARSASGPDDQSAFFAAVQNHQPSNEVCIEYW